VFEYEEKSQQTFLLYQAYAFETLTLKMKELVKHLIGLASEGRLEQSSLE